jgi:ribose transport system substrate-binding protein
VTARRIGAILALAALFVMFALPVAEAKTYRVVLILKNFVNPVWLDMQRGGEAAAKELGIDLKTLAPLKADNNEEQVKAIEDAIIQKVDAIVVVPSDSNGIIPAIEKANKAGIPVINVNTKANGGECETFVAVENYDAAYMVADAMAKKLNGQGTVIVLEGVPGAQSAIDLDAGTKDALKNYPGISIVASQTAKFQRAEAMKVMENLLQRFPNVSAVLAANDEMALGAVEAIDAIGKTGKILVSGLDANADAVKAIADGKMTLSCDKRSYQQGYEGVKAAFNFLNGEALPARIVIETTIVDSSNISQYVK